MRTKRCLYKILREIQNCKTASMVSKQSVFSLMLIIKEQSDIYGHGLQLNFFKSKLCYARKGSSKTRR